ncbi:PAS domain-containing sensor histidine kinase [Phenylobacterium sp.]|uniref:sensor histidine kinase n=1 Tax=Phenylobacterium sp. TaxID=1871053 RepID=UPI0012158962|nr:PAS domain-containing sensor histidine kinase [Phenylobacterium sp.]THD58099.1 MAG: PAS domain-containing sensor histidine kinase [Phenylobacterium sp.]
MDARRIAMLEASRELKPMTRLWPAFRAIPVDGGNSLRGFFLGQVLALLASVAALALHMLFGPIFSHSVYLFCLPAVLICAAFGGFPSAMSATVILAIGAFVADAYAALTLPEQVGRAAVFLLLGAGFALVGGQLRRMIVGQEQQLIELAERAAILRASLDAASDASVVVDEEGVVIGFSHAAEAVFGWTAAEVIGRNAAILMPLSDAQGHDNHIRRYVETGERRVVGSSRMVTGRRKDGEAFSMELRLGELRVGRRRYFIGAVRDLSTMREAERRSDELQAHLTQVWSLNSMGEMASVLAHELNQPLSAVANYLRAARTLIAHHEIDDDDLIDAVSRAGDQAVRAGEIIRTMRDLATRGGTEQKAESLSGILGEIEFIIGLMVRDAGARVFYDLYQGPDVVLADRIQIQQLVVNLVRNAIDAVAKFPDREIKISTKPDADGKLLTTVEDSGPGVDTAVMGRVFQPLASTKPTGMGLGLSICRAIVENHGGRIWVESSPLGGAAFRFVLARTSVKGDDASVRTDRVRRR